MDTPHPHLAHAHQLNGQYTYPTFQYQQRTEYEHTSSTAAAAAATAYHPQHQMNPVRTIQSTTQPSTSTSSSSLALALCEDHLSRSALPSTARTLEREVVPIAPLSYTGAPLSHPSYHEDHSKHQNMLFPMSVDHGVGVQQGTNYPDYHQHSSLTYDISSPLNACYDTPSQPEMGFMNGQYVSLGLYGSPTYMDDPSYYSSPSPFDQSEVAAATPQTVPPPPPVFRNNRSYTLESAMTLPEPKAHSESPKSPPQTPSDMVSDAAPSPPAFGETTRTRTQTEGSPFASCSTLRPTMVSFSQPSAASSPPVQPRKSPKLSSTVGPSSHVIDVSNKGKQTIFKLNEQAVPKEPYKKKPIMACMFCRERKIACGPPVPGAADQRCGQCIRRDLPHCEFPKESRRGQHRRTPRAARVQALADRTTIPLEPTVEGESVFSATSPSAASSVSTDTKSKSRSPVRRNSATTAAAARVEDQKAASERRAANRKQRRMVVLPAEQQRTSSPVKSEP